MFDVQGRLDFLDASHKGLSDLTVLNEALNLDFSEFDKPYEKFMESVATFETQFKHRYQMLSEPQFAQARNDEELRQAAIARKRVAQKWLKEYQERKEQDQRNAWREKAELAAHGVLRDMDMPHEIQEMEWDDMIHAEIAKAHVIECNLMLKAIEAFQEEKKCSHA